MQELCANCCNKCAQYLLRIYRIGAHNCCNSFVQNNKKKNNMKLWLILSICAGTLIAICSCIIIAIMVTGWQQNVKDTWNIASTQTTNNILQVLNQNLNFLKFASTSPPFIEPLLANQNMPFSNYDASRLTRMFNAYDGESGFNFGSFGMLLRANNYSNAKLSWQIAKGFGCPDYIYAFSDASINPSFYGYCAYQNGTIDTSKLAYNGFDWGLKPEEVQILDGTIPYTFLPIFNLLGQFTLTFETSSSLSFPKYAVTFAEISLNSFTDFVANNVSLSLNSYVYVVETVSGDMIASNIQNTVIDSDGKRLNARKSLSGIIQETFEQISNNKWIISTNNYKDIGIDWTIYVVALESSIYGNMTYRIMVTSLISMAIIIISIAIIVIIMRVFVQKSINKLVARAKGEPFGEEYIKIDEFQPMQILIK